MKAVISCSDKSDERLNAERAVYRGGGKGDRDWTQEPTGQAVNWDRDTWHKLRVEWKDKRFKVFVDGQQKWGTAGPYDYAPVQHRVDRFSA